jgi:arylsulfatase A-like enzyme
LDLRQPASIPSEGCGKRANILFIHTDQHRADALGCAGNPVIRTPYLDQLAKEGVLFENAHCTHPLCMPSRATLLTGRYMHSHQLYRNGIPLNESEPLITEQLQKQGYRTGLLGKAHFTPYHGDPNEHLESVQLNNGVSPENCWAFWQNADKPYYGFEHVRLSMGHGSYGMNGGHYGLWVHEQHPDKVRLFSQAEALEPTDDSYPSWKSAVPLEIHSSTWITNETIKFIEDSRQQPFYAWVGFQEPHEPFNPPKPYCDMYDPADMPLPVRRDGEWTDAPEHVRYYLNRGKWGELSEDKAREIIAHYYANVTLVDECIGRIIDCLKRNGLYDNTIIVFTSDHGEWLGDHRLWLKGAVHTRGLTRVPLLMRWPGVSKAGLTVPGVASLVDLMPTLLDAAGADIPYGVQGKSLREVLTGSVPQLREYALIEHRHEPRSINLQFEPEGLVLNKSEREFHIKTIVTNRYRLSHFTGCEYGELFDLQQDPGELDNLWRREENLRTKLQLQLLDALIESEDPLPQRRWPV